MRMRLWVFIGCIAVPFGSFGVLPNGSILRQRLGRECVIPDVFQKCIEQKKMLAAKGGTLSPEERKKLRLTPFEKGMKEAAGSEVKVIVQSDRWVLGFESGKGFEDECAEDGDARSSGTDLLSIWVENGKEGDPFGGEEIREKATRRCNDVFESTEFWADVLGVEWFEAIVRELQREDGCPYVRLETSMRSFLCDTFPRSKSLLKFCKDGKILPKASEMLVFYLQFELGHWDRVNKKTGKHIRLSNDFKDLILPEDAEPVTDLKFSLRLIVDMMQERIKEVRLTDKFFVKGRPIIKFGGQGFLGFTEQ